MSSLFFAKRRILNIILTIEQIYDNLNKLRDINKNSKENFKIKNQKEEQDFFCKLYSEM